MVRVDARGAAIRSPSMRRQSRDVAAALALAGATVAALVWANIGDSYATFWSLHAGIGVGAARFTLPLSGWVNDALMVVFFFAVGLDVRREFTLGELRQRGRAILPVAAALGGLVVPPLLFLALNAGGEGSSAWGAVISTDTAFALGMLALVGPKNAPRLRIFLLALSVVDDIGALTVIAVFYTHDLNLFALGLAAIGLLVIWLLQRRAVWRVTPYIVVSVGIWLAMFASGVQATLTGVLVALLIPVYPTRPADVENASLAVHLFRQAPRARAARLAKSSIDQSVPMNQRVSELLPPYVNFVIVPLFALANAGVPLSGEMLRAAATSPLTWGIIVGLVLGKPIGITLSSRLVQRFVPASRAPGLDLPRLVGLGSLSGMGFTISLLVVGLAISDQELQDEARVGVLVASALALLIAGIVFWAGSRLRPLPAPSGLTLPRPVQVSRDHLRGPANAPATVVVYAAIGPGYRAYTAEVLEEVRRRLGDRLRIVFRHHAVTDDEVTFALMLEAADGQGRFWAMHDRLVADRQALPGSYDLNALAEETGLVADRFVHDVETSARLARVQDDNLDAEAVDLPPRPVLYINGRRLEGPANSRYVTRVLEAGSAGGSDGAG